MRELDSHSHSVFSLTYHLIMVIKYRRKVIDDRIAMHIREIGEYIGQNYRITFLEYNHDQDHIHILFKAHPNTPIFKYIDAYKSASSRLIKKELPQVRKQLWKENFWSQSFCLLTTGGAPLEVIKKYLESQGKKGYHADHLSIPAVSDKGARRKTESNPTSLATIV